VESSASRKSPPLVRKRWGRGGRTGRAHRIMEKCRSSDVSASSLRFASAPPSGGMLAPPDPKTKGMLSAPSGTERGRGLVGEKFVPGGAPPPTTAVLPFLRCITVSLSDIYLSTQGSLSNCLAGMVQSTRSRLSVVVVVHKGLGVNSSCCWFPIAVPRLAVAQ
jgi:hypothetical protein